MERVLDVYKRPYDKDYPVVCMDESQKQLIGETRVPIPMSKGHDRKCDYEYERLGVCNIFLANEPLAGFRTVKITDRKCKVDWAEFIKEIADEHYHSAEIELNLFNNQCLGRRIGTIEEVREEVGAWEQAHNGLDKKINWQFTTEKARIKLKIFFYLKKFIYMDQSLRKMKLKLSLKALLLVFH